MQIEVEGFTILNGSSPEFVEIFFEGSAKYYIRVVPFFHHNPCS